MSGAERHFEIVADFHQFLVGDARADWTSLADLWTADSVQEMFCQGDGYVAIGTARDTVAPVSLTVETRPPARPVEEPDRTATGMVNVPSGRLIVTGITDNGASGGEVSVTPGFYRLLVRYYGLDSVSQDGLEGDDRYDLFAWPEMGDSHI